MSGESTELPYVEIWLRFECHGETYVFMRMPAGQDSEEWPREPEWAEINVPYHTSDTVYCLVCVMVGIPAYEPAVEVALWLMEQRNQIGQALGLPAMVEANR